MKIVVVLRDNCKKISCIRQTVKYVSFMVNNDDMYLRFSKRMIILLVLQVFYCVHFIEGYIFSCIYTFTDCSSLRKWLQKSFCQKKNSCRKNSCWNIIIYNQCIGLCAIKYIKIDPLLPSLSLKPFGDADDAGVQNYI